MRRYVGLAFLLIALLTLVVWGISQFIQPILPGNLNNSLVLLFAALLGVVAFLAGFKDIVELLHLYSQHPKNIENEPNILSSAVNSPLDISSQQNDWNNQVDKNDKVNPAQLQDIRLRMNRSFDDPQLDAFILDYFPKIYDRLGRGMLKDEKLTLLLNHCRQSKSRFQYLVSCLEQAEK